MPEPTTPEPTTPEPTTPEVTTPKEIIKEKIISAVIPEFEYSDLQKLYEPEDPLVLAEYVEKIDKYLLMDPAINNGLIYFEHTEEDQLLAHLNVLPGFDPVEVNEKYPDSTVQALRRFDIEVNEKYPDSTVQALR